jgi:hypothetical protein
MPRFFFKRLWQPWLEKGTKMDRQLILATEVQDQPVRWLWPDRIPYRAISILEGPPGIGKSVVTYDLAARITSGKAMPNRSDGTTPAGVVLLQAEDCIARTVRPNLQAAGADLSKVALLDKNRFATQPFLLPNDLPLIEQAVIKVCAKLVIIDPLTAFVGTNTNVDVTVRKILGPLGELAERYDLAILIVRHLRKVGAKNSLYSGAGSIGIIASARSSLMIGRDPSSDSKYQHVLALNKSNMADANSISFRTIKRPDEAITVEWLEESRYSANEINAAENQADAHTSLREAMYVLYSLLAEGSLPACMVIQLAKKAGIAERTLQRAKKELRVRSLKKGSGFDSHWFWVLPEDESLLRPLKDKDLGELMDRLIYGDEDMATREGLWKRAHNSKRKNAGNPGDDGDPLPK